MRKKRRRYPETFKKEPVEYLISSGKPIIHVARELGLHDATLGIWKRQYASTKSLHQLATRAMVVESIAWIARLKRRGSPR
jgi:transposase-like protein